MATDATGVAAVRQRVTIRSTIAPLMQAARPSSGQVSQLLRGHHAEVLEQDGQWLRVRGADGYDGWCHRGYVTMEHEHCETPKPLHNAWSSECRMSLGCVVRTQVGAGTGDAIALPPGALLDSDDEVVHGIAMNQRARLRYFEREPDCVAQRAVELFRGTPYQWGGVTPWGADCSGMIQTLFALHGVQLPRDAWMQAERGREVQGDIADLQKGDLIFFSDRDDGGITHVALSLSGARLTHCSLANGGFAINSLDATDPVARGLRDTFRFARRIM